MVEERVIAEHLTALLAPIFEENLLQLVSAKTLLLLARGFDHFLFWQQLIDKGIHFITRRKINAAIEYQQVFTDGHALRARLVKIGSGTKKTPYLQKCLGIVKRQRKPKQKLIVAPFPDKQRGYDQFFFQSSSKSPLTSCLQA